MVPPTPPPHEKPSCYRWFFLYTISPKRLAILIEVTLGLVHNSHRQTKYLIRELPGFTLIPDFITEAQEAALIYELDAQPWLVDYQRRLQYFGYRNELEKPYDLVPFPVQFPTLIQRLAQNISEDQIVEFMPNQVIINEYLPGEGIRPHKDSDYFENQICGVNLGSGCVMRFTKAKETIDFEVQRRSLYVMQDDARKKWKHSIPPKKKDTIEGELKLRDRRVSITYRKVKESKVHPINLDGKAAEMLKRYFNIEVGT